MGDNAPQGEDAGREMEAWRSNQGNENLIRASAGSASYRERHNRKTNHVQEEKRNTSVIFPVLCLLFGGVFVKLRCAVSLIVLSHRAKVHTVCLQMCVSFPVS